MSITRLARLHEIPLLERCGYRAVRQRGGLVEMVQSSDGVVEGNEPEAVKLVGKCRSEPIQRACDGRSEATTTRAAGIKPSPSDAKPDDLCTKRKEPAKPKLPDWDDLRGVAPDATGDLSSEEFVRKIRSEWPDKDAERLAFEVMANWMGANV